MNICSMKIKFLLLRGSWNNFGKKYKASYPYACDCKKVTEELVSCDNDY